MSPGFDSAPRRPVVGVGVVCLRDHDVLLIRRAKPPMMGQWSLPGGRLEWAESLADAALRELGEETGVEATLLGLVDVVDAIVEDSHHVLVDYAARWTAGEPRAGDDASEAAFFPWEDAARMVTWSETTRIIQAAARIYLLSGLASANPSD